MSSSGGCPRGNESCPFFSGGSYCGHREVCQDLADLFREVEVFVMVSGAYMPPERDGDIVAYSGGLTTYRLFPRPTQTEAARATDESERY